MRLTSLVRCLFQMHQGDVWQDQAYNFCVVSNKCNLLLALADESVSEAWKLAFQVTLYVTFNKWDVDHNLINALFFRELSK